MFDLLNTFPHESEVESPAQSSPARGSHMPRTVNVLENSLYTKNKAHFWTRKSNQFFAISVNRRYTLYEHEK